MLKVPTVLLAALALAATAAPSALAAQAPGRVTFALPGAEKPINGEPPGSGAAALSMRPDGGADVVGFAPGRKVVLARITRAGALDTSFGSKGFATPALPSGLNPEQLLRQADGKLILVAGGPAGSKYQLPDYELARFNTDGTLDTSFGSGGLVRLNGIQTGCVDCHAAELTATGQIVLAAATGSQSPDIEHNPNAPANFRFAVARLNSDGSLDPTFGDKGVATLPGFGYAEGLALGAGGTITAFGTSGQTVATQTGQMVRLTPLGTVDPTFNGGAAAPLPFKAPRHVALAADGSLRILGLNATGATEVARYTALGAQDTSYGSGGLVTLPASVGSSARLLVDGAGTLIVGSSLGAASPGISVLRLTANGQPDAATGGASGRHIDAPFGGGDLSARGEGPFVQDSFFTSAQDQVGRRADGSLLVLGNAHVTRFSGEGAGTFIDQAATMSLTPTFGLDSSFGGSGGLKVTTRVSTQRVRVTKTNSKAYLKLSGVKVRIDGTQPGLARVSVRNGKTTIASGVVAVFLSGSHDVKVLLTAKGRALLRHPHRLHVTVSTTLRDLAANRASARGKGVVVS